MCFLKAFSLIKPLLYLAAALKSHVLYKAGHGMGGFSKKSSSGPLYHRRGVWALPCPMESFSAGAETKDFCLICELIRLDLRSQEVSLEPSRCPDTARKWTRRLFCCPWEPPPLSLCSDIPCCPSPLSQQFLLLCMLSSQAPAIPRDKLNARDSRRLAWACAGWGLSGQPTELQLPDRAGWSRDCPETQMSPAEVGLVSHTCHST